MRNPIVFMFSGQGSQYYHMGKELYNQNSAFRNWMLKLNDIAYKYAGRSIIDEIYNESKSKADPFDQLQYTHPAIFMTEYALARVFIESGTEPDYVLGASLGEFTTAAVTGVLSMEEALECVIKQAEMVKSYCPAGGMIAIVANPDLYHRTPLISLHSELAAINFSSHFIISGAYDNLILIEKYLKAEEHLFQTLPVRYGFHSTKIDPVEAQYKEFLQHYSFNKPEKRIISSLSGGEATQISKEYLWDVVRKPIHFQKAILGLEENQPFNYIDLGPSGTLANFVRKILNADSQSQVYDLLTPFAQDVKKYNKILETFEK